MKDLMAAWKEAEEIFGLLIQGGGCELDDEDVTRLRALRQVILRYGVDYGAEFLPEATLADRVQRVEESLQAVKTWTAFRSKGGE